MKLTIIFVFTVVCNLSMTTVSGYTRQAQWIQIGGKNYDFNAAPLTQSEAAARCIRFGGRLFEPRDAKTNRDVFVQAGTKFNGNTKLWIGVTDIGTENKFTYVSDGTLVNFNCAGSAGGRAGCWRALQPITETATPVTTPATDPTAELTGTNAAGNDQAGIVPLASQNLDCVYGRADRDGKWATSKCATNVVGRPITTAIDAALLSPEAAGAYTFTATTTAARFGSICEQAQAPITTTQPPTTTTSDSTCLKSGISVMIGMLFFCYQ